MTSRPARAHSKFGTCRMHVLAAVALVLPLCIGTAPAIASEGAKPNGCPWAQDVTLEINGKTLTLKQESFTAVTSEPIEIEQFKVFPLVDQLKLRIIGPKGREWEAALTRLVSGKRCSAFYAGKPELVSDTVRDPNELILNR
ncbi:hypothetical protein A6A40_06050 [Azospirillum humicireducens]|uniref:Uncharacterized protein n=1 Tax=Azospirillum humicireducens TaxID=1226968 RepID=A0A160JF75_9PROT|nr:hypothetical protein [Azospirillum humicireducens]ANC91500.1 hypothetical protein A6A40_06050 [Azospirillum humicireducens]